MRQNIRQRRYENLRRIEEEAEREEVKQEQSIHVSRPLAVAAAI